MRRRVFAFLIVCLLVAACGTKDLTAQTPVPPIVTSLPPTMTPVPPTTTPLPPTATPVPSTATPEPGAGTVVLIFGDRFIKELYVTVRSTLEEADYRVHVASTTLDPLEPKLSGELVQPDLLLEDLQVEDYDAILFTCDNDLAFGGGRPETDRIAQEAVAQNKVLGAICNAPLELGFAGVLEAKQATGEPSQTCQRLESEFGATCTGALVERDGLIVTARDRYASRAFAQTIVEVLQEQPVAAVSFEQSQQSFPSVPTYQIGLGDLDKDGDLDAVFANARSNHSQVWLNDGSGYFVDSGQQLTQQGHGISLGDLDNDGDLDLLMTCHQNSRPSRVYLNDGYAVFRDSGQDFDDARLSGNAANLADIDGDGDLDAIILYYEQGHRVYWNDGDGWFASSEITFPDNSVWGDLDSDGDVDVFIKQDGVGYKTMLNDGSGGFLEAWGYEDATTMVHGDVALGDVDNDGDLDAIITNGDYRSQGYPVLVFWNDGSGQFTDSGQQLGAVRNASVNLGDLNGDGYLDIVFTDFERPNQVWINDGSGQYSDSGFRFGADQFYRYAHLGDLDQDGDLDVFVATFGIDGGPNEIWFNTGTLSTPGGVERLIAFVSTRDGNGEIYVMPAPGPQGQVDADGGDVRRLTNHRLWDGFPDWSPDGKQIVYYSYLSDENWVIKVMNADGSNSRQLTDSAVCDGAPHWSPDGTRIASASDADCTAEHRGIYVMNADGGEQRNLTQNPASVFVSSA